MNLNKIQVWRGIIRHFGFSLKYTCCSLWWTQMSDRMLMVDGRPQWNVHRWPFIATHGSFYWIFFCATFRYSTWKKFHCSGCACRTTQNEYNIFERADNIFCICENSFISTRPLHPLSALDIVFLKHLVCVFRL